jgi:hypothetical protein
MGNDQPPTGEWISRARFDQAYGAAGVDQDFGVMWGPHRNQRVSVRVAPGELHGVLHVYDPMWDEYNVLDHGATLAEVRRAFDAVVTTVGYRGVGVDALAEAVRREQSAPLFEAAIQPSSGRELGLEP